jgi:transcriptional regulator with XRE-family HTH domain
MARENLERLINQEDFILEVTEAFCEYMEHHKISRTYLAEKLGKSRSFVSQVLNGGRNLTVRTIADMASALDAKPFFRLRDAEGFAVDVDWYLYTESEQSCMLALDKGVMKEIRRINLVDDLTNRKHWYADHQFDDGVTKAHAGKAGISRSQEKQEQAVDEYLVKYAVAGGGRG